MTPPPFQRARSAESKQQRAQSLVDAARALALEQGAAGVTLTAVANRAGVHHSAMRRYFTSHKDVLLHLAADGWSRWAGAVRGELAGRTVSVTELATVLTATLCADPLFCDLLANVPLHLEHDVPVESVIEFKKTGRHAVETIASAIRDSAPSLADSAIDVVTAANALAATLWQATHPAAPLAEAIRRDPSLSLVEPGDFEDILGRLLAATCEGLSA
jgi:AcrR family transcriptional regulator